MAPGTGVNDIYSLKNVHCISHINIIKDIKTALSSKKECKADWSIDDSGVQNSVTLISTR